jgi:anti-anti-sigma factor
LRIELQRVHQRTALGVNEHPDRLQAIAGCSYLLQFQHIPSPASLALRVPSRKQARRLASGKPVFQGGICDQHIRNPHASVDLLSRRTDRSAELTELVRDHEQELLARLTPLVRRQSVTLDLRRVRCIDAAGVAALLALYTSARAAGHCFSVTNPAPRVAEVLALVGLERILLSHNAPRKPHSGQRFQLHAA